MARVKRSVRIGMAIPPALVYARRFIVWPDNDKAGKRYAEAAAERLRALGCTVATTDAVALALPEKAIAWTGVRITRKPRQPTCWRCASLK